MSSQPQTTKTPHEKFAEALRRSVADPPPEKSILPSDTTSNAYLLEEIRKKFDELFGPQD